MFSTALIVDEVGSPFKTSSVELAPLRPTEVLVELKATGVCHTDTAVQQGKLPGEYPTVLGHEGKEINSLNLRCSDKLIIILFRGWNSKRNWKRRSGCCSWRSCSALIFVLWRMPQLQEGANVSMHEHV